MRGITLLFCSVTLWACDDGAEPEPSGVGGEAGEGGEGGQAGQGGEGGGGALAESCDHVTRCATEGAVCREDRNGWRCVVNDVPVGQECEEHADCGPGWPVSYCAGSASDGPDAPKTCHLTCYYDVTCPDEMVCERGANGRCVLAE